MTKSSRIPGFYRFTVDERRKLIWEGSEAHPAEDLKSASIIWNEGGLNVETADQIVENVLGIYSLPFGVGLNAKINGEDRLIPMVVEEPSVIAAVSNACRMLRHGGGFTATVDESLMIAQVELRSIADLDAAEERIRDNEDDLLRLARETVPGLIKRGGGPKALELRRIGPGHLVVHILVDCCDAMGANLVNTVAEGTGPRLAELCGAQLGLRILSNLSDRRCVSVKATLKLSALTTKGSAGQLDPSKLLDEIEAASVFAERDPYRAATHNKGIMNGIDSVILATGNDYRAVEAGAHAYAARRGSYQPLATWKRKEDSLVGEMKLPLALGIVGGTLRVHPGARLALSIAQVRNASDLEMLAACAGLASNLAALRALSAEGIQKGHMALHARSVAISAGARADEVAPIANTISTAGRVNRQEAEQALRALRALSENKAAPE